jgi:hypothetical protein
MQFQYSAVGNPVFSAPFVEEAVFSPMRILGIFVKNYMAVIAWACVKVF